MLVTRLAFFMRDPLAWPIRFFAVDLNALPVGPEPMKGLFSFAQIY